MPTPNVDLLSLINQAHDENWEELDLSGMGLTELPIEIGMLTGLKRLVLGKYDREKREYVGNSFTEIPEVVFELKQLEELLIAKSQITEIPDSIGQLTHLTQLDIWDNQITELPESIGQLTNLTQLGLISNQIMELPESIGQLTNLTLLDLSSNQITDIPDSIAQLTNLTQLYLSDNQITEIPESIAQLTNLKRLVLENNPIQNVLPEIIRKGWGEETYRDGEPQIIFAFLKSIQNSKRPLNELKVLLVGQGDVGKTSLIKRLKDNTFNANERKTHGIEIYPWQLNVNQQSININFWDFGGQEIMHATHQFFLTKRSIYLLVLKNRETDEQNRLEYWLEIINSLSNQSPILIIGNQSDQHPLDTNPKHYQDKYPNLKGFISTSCETGDGIQTLINQLTHIITELPHIHNPIPETWFKLKKALETLDKDYIPYEHYSQLCQTHNIPEPTEQANLLQLLHDLGTVLNFAENDRLQDTNVLNPTWVTTGIYKILNDNDLMTQHQGILPRPELSRILDSKHYPKSKHRFILDMMQEFELCIPLESGNHWLIPDLLPKSEPDTGDWDNALQFQYHYNILPQSIISRFIVRMSHCISKNTYWRTGVVLRDQGNRAIVRADLYDRIISIAISGHPSTRRAFLHTIRNCFQAIHRTLEKLNVKEKVPLPENPKIIVDYQQLLTYERKGVPELIPEGYDELVNVKSLLNGIEPPDLRQKHDRDRYNDQRPTIIIAPNFNNNNHQEQTMTDTSKTNQFNGPMSGIIGSDNTQVSAPIANSIATDNAQITVNQTNNTSTEDLLKLITALRQTSRLKSSKKLTLISKISKPKSSNPKPIVILPVSKNVLPRSSPRSVS
jgi:internalin A